MAQNNADEKAAAAVKLSSEEPANAAELINASGHRQEVQRNFSLLSICAVAVTTGNTWIAQGGSVAVALYNGGLSGVLYELYALLPRGICKFSTNSVSNFQHCCFRLLLARGSKYRRAGIWNAIRQWCLPLGHHYRREVWSRVRLLCGVLELSRMDARSVVNVGNLGATTGVDVCLDASRLHTAGLACVPGIYSLDLAVLQRGSVHEQSTAEYWESW